MKYSSAMASGLAADDIRALFQLTGELRELGSDPASWREHLARALETLCGAQVVVVTELRVNPPAQPAPHAAGGELRHRGDAAADPGSRAVAGDSKSFFDDLYWASHRLDDTLLPIIDLYGTAFTVLRSDVVDDARWFRSAMANERYRRFECGDFTMSMAPVDHLGVICGMEIYRVWGEPSFTPRDRLIVDLLHGELTRDWERAVEQAPA